MKNPLNCLKLQKRKLTVSINIEQDWVALENINVHSYMKEWKYIRFSANGCAIALILHANKVLIKIFQSRIQPYMNREMTNEQIGFRKD